MANPSELGEPVILTISVPVGSDEAGEVAPISLLFSTRLAYQNPVSPIPGKRLYMTIADVSNGTISSYP